MQSSNSSGGVWVMLIFMGAAYLLPLIVAVARKHNSIGVIALVNIVFGWSVIGWIIALIWSMNSNTREHDLRRAMLHAEVSRPVAGASLPSSSLSSELQRLAAMRDSGTLTPAEFERAKEKLIAS